MFEKLKKKGFEILALHHAEAILKHDMMDAVYEIEDVLLEAKIPVEELVRGGGGEGEFTQRLRKSFADKHGWKSTVLRSKKSWMEEKESISHEIDHVKKFKTGTFVLEIEWNNKDPFFDRDLENFKRLHADGVISVGSIITRGESLQSALRREIADFAIKQDMKNIGELFKFYAPTSRQIEKLNWQRKPKDHLLRVGHMCVCFR
ncbi:MAG: restriction endonuclease [Candidatus Omnitrophica bacterium]|nr:restriction endonuclease [Candidatus Omnitrophota bacterium]